MGGEPLLVLFLGLLSGIVILFCSGVFLGELRERRFAGDLKSLDKRGQCMGSLILKTCGSNNRVESTLSAAESQSVKQTSEVWYIHTRNAI